MSRTQEKIKDIVEPQAYEEVQDFFADPARSLTAYRFTDATADLLARWLDALADLPRGKGAAHALAGLRGVGKSHSLAAFGALIAPELRQNISDAHVGVSARRLTNRRHMVVHVARGTHTTLEEEVSAGLRAGFGNDAAGWGPTPVEALAGAMQHARGATLVLLVDTAYGREARVSRDDGPLLSELAEAAKEAGAFIALALDDDIAGAEGVNAALARTFQIDYLEPDHLYQVANNYLLRKHEPARAALHDIYLSLRNSVPGFNWSEPRFAALYPLHPLVADVSAAVRMHAPHFAFLPFAANAAQQAVNRPALSLILLDEVFDRTEKELRGAAELVETFKIYDALATQAVKQFPAMQRLQVRLILKSLFVLSLDGRGATARELCAALLFQNEGAAGDKAAIGRVEEILRRLSQGAPAECLHAYADGGEIRYRCQNGEDDFNAALTQAVGQVAADDTALFELFRLLAHARFADWPLTAAQGNGAAADFAVIWRGTSRPGRLIDQNFDEPPADTTAERYDWELIVLEAGADERQDEPPLPSHQDETAAGDVPIRVVWQPASVTPEELGVLHRLIALRADAALANFGDAARAATNSLAAQAEGIWTRLYLDDGVLLIDGDRFRFTAEARASASLAATLAQLLAPLFAQRYPQHPTFSAPLNESAAARLTELLFGGTSVAGTDGQTLARLYALPLSLAAQRGDRYTFEIGDEALKCPWVKAALAPVEAAEGAVVPLTGVRKILRRAPFGLLCEAQQIVLAALVAQRRIELVTPAGDSLSRRTLRHAIDWESVTGVRRCAALQHNAAALTQWAQRLTGRGDLASLSEADGYDEVRVALTVWFTDWRARGVLEKFADAPDSGLTTRAWNLAAAVRRTFGSVAESIASALADDITLEEGLQRASDTFADSPELFARCHAQLESLAAYTSSLDEREAVRAYLTAAEPTGVDEIESARRELLALTDDIHALFDVVRRERLSLLWRGFHARYIDHYAEAHERAVGGGSSDAGRPSLDELTRSAEWREFEALSQLPFINRALWDEAAALVARVRHARCQLPVRELLAEQPRCACQFRLAHAGAWPDVIADLAELSVRGRAAARRTLSLFHQHLARALNLLTRDGQSAETAQRAYRLADAFTKGQHPELYTHADARLIAAALDVQPASQPLRVSLPTDNYGLLTREELTAYMQQWLDELPIGPLLVELAGERRTDAT